jgi:transposase
MNLEIKARLKWVQLYEETGDAGFVCRRCGISRPTLRKWSRRFKERGLEGLRSRSRRPHKSPRQKISSENERIILELRRQHKLGARRIQNELLRNQELSFSLATIHKVLSRHNVKPLKPYRRKKSYKRYQRPISGDRVQMDTMKVATGLYQYTAVDDCSRFRVLGLYKRRAAANTLCFQGYLKRCPFQYSAFKLIEAQNFLPLKSRNTF